MDNLKEKFTGEEVGTLEYSGEVNAGFSIIFNEVWELNLTTNEKILYMALLSFIPVYSNRQNCYPPVKKLCEMTGCSESTIKRSTKKLVEKGVLTKISQYRENGSQTVNNYILKDAKKALIEQKETQKKVLANNHEDKDKGKEQNIKNNSIAFDSNSDNNKCQEEVDTKKKDFGKVREIVKEPLKDTEIKTILKVANNDFEVIKANYALTKGQDIEKMGAWLVYAIKHKLADQQEPIKNPQEAPKRPNKPSNEYKPVNTTTPPFKASKNKFNEFPQRNYTKEEFLTMEQRLLNRE